MVDKIAHFQQRLAETIAWCASKEWVGNPAEKLRSLESRPPELKEQDDTILLTAA
jgi:hypothetical protein